MKILTTQFALIWHSSSSMLNLKIWQEFIKLIALLLHNANIFPLLQIQPLCEYSNIMFVIVYSLFSRQSIFWGSINYSKIRLHIDQNQCHKLLSSPSVIKVKYTFPLIFFKYLETSTSIDISFPLPPLHLFFRQNDYSSLKDYSLDIFQPFHYHNSHLLNF